MNKAYLLTGSNIGNRISYLNQALDLLNERAGRILRRSGVYETAAWGKTDQPAFLNQALLLETGLTPDQLMKLLLDIEKEIGRERVEKYGPRIIDIDILLFNDEVVETALVKIPHPELPRRRFALTPLAEIAPTLLHPSLRRTIKELSAACSDPLPLQKWNTNDSSQINKMNYRFIAIEGNIGAGKTTLAHLLSRHYKARLILEEFADNPFLPRFYESPDQYAFPLELFFMAERYKQLKEQLQSQDLFSAVTFSDYFFSKSLLFARNTLKEEEFRLFQKMYDILYPQLIQPELLLFLHSPVNRLQNNIRRRGRDFEKAISGEYLYGLQETYTQYIRQHNTKTIVVDVSNADFLGNEKHLPAVINALEREYEGDGPHHISLPD